MADVNALFDEFAIRRARGERPDIDDYLDRAGDAAAELADLIEGLLMSAPTPAPAPEDAVIVRALLAGQPPIQALRAAKGVRREAVVDRLRRALGTPERLRDRLRDRYHDLEAGLVDVRAVDRRVIDAVAGALGMAASDLPAWRLGPAGEQAEYAMARSALPVERFDVPDVAGHSPPPDPEAAELDRLFGLS
ncbi:MAG: hypothetical protein KDC33_11305 [Thermoleophilia bacterium]|nr:hypothetical protein [Thermoleophilia bacterium]